MLSQQQLTQVGLEHEEAESLLAHWSQLREQVTEPTERWQTASQRLLESRLPLAEHWQVWQYLFEDWDSQRRGPAPMWSPSKATIQQANLTQLMKAAGHTTYDQLYQWSIQHRDSFWQQVVQQLEISFDHPPDEILNLQAGAEHPQWLAAASMNIVESCFQADPEQTAIISGTSGGEIQRQSFYELRRQVNRVSSSLTAAGFQAGDRLAILMPMNADAVAIYLGVIQAGCVAISIADSFAPPEIKRRLEIGQANGVFCCDRYVRAGKTIDLYSKVIQANSPTAIVLSHREDHPPELRNGDVAWNDFLVDADQFNPHYSGPDHPINILFSSGTTGDPKAIPWNQTTPIKAAADGRFHQDLRTGDVAVWPTNLGWMMGPWLIFASLINRATIGLYDDVPNSAGFGRFVQDAGVTMLGVIPTLVRAWRTTRCMESCDWSAIRCFSSTGEVSQRQDMFYLSSLAGYKPIIEYCGGTEIGGGFVTSTVVQPNAPSCFSTAALGSEMLILDEQGEPTDQGELYLVPPSMGLSTQLLNRDHHQTYYAGTPQLRDDVPLRRHGDHFQRLAGGYYQARGRVDDTMNLGGIKVSSAEIEQVLSTLPGVLEVAAVAQPDQEGGPDALVVFAVLRPDQAVSSEAGNEYDLRKDLLAQMNQQIRQKLNPLFKVAEVHLMQSIPRTASNKVIRRALRDSLRQGGLSKE